MPALDRTRPALSPPEQRLVARATAMKVAACALALVLVALIGLSTLDPMPPGAPEAPGAAFEPSLDPAAIDRRRLFDERRARFEAARRIALSNASTASEASGHSKR